MSPSPPIVLAFAASDPTGGAGLQADVLTIAAMGCHPLSVLTALTVQDTAGVESLRGIDARWVDDQARRLLAEIRVDAFKLGVLGSARLGISPRSRACSPSIPTFRWCATRCLHPAAATPWRAAK